MNPLPTDQQPSVPPPAVPPRALHVESTSGALLAVGDKAAYQSALDGVAASLLPEESILWLATVHRDTPGIGGTQCLAAVTTHRFAVLPKTEEDGPLVRFHGLHSELQFRVIKRGRLFGTVEVSAGGASAELGVTPAQVDSLQELLAGVARRDASLLRPDARAYDPSAGPWWDQLAEDYAYEWANTNYVIEPGGTSRRSAPLRIDRTGLRFGSAARPDRHVAWPDVLDIGTRGVKPGLFRQARSGGEGFVGAFAGGIDPSESGQMALFVVQTRDLEVHVNVTTFSPTPLARLLATLDAFVQAHVEGRLPGTAAAPPPPAPPAPTSPPQASAAPSPPAAGPAPEPPPSAEPAPVPEGDAAARLAQVREQLKMIEALRAEGLLSDDELAAKRAEVLARI